jgi:hypothetical protein
MKEGEQILKQAEDVEQWMAEMLDIHQQPSIRAVVNSPGYMETWGATRFLLHEEPEEKCIHRGLTPDPEAEFWEKYGWSGPLTEQQQGEVLATLLLYNQSLTHSKDT